MKIIVSSEICDMCGTCITVCQSNAISMHNDSVFIDQKRCVYCKHCINVCPVAALKKAKQPGE